MRFKASNIREQKKCHRKDFTSMVGDIIVEDRLKKLEKGEMVYANGTD